MDSSEGAGRPRKVTKKDVYEAFNRVPGPAATGSELARELGVSKQTVLRRLHDLHEQGCVESKDCGVKIWWRDDTPE
ncbi:MarR family transcriptional regulator [Haloferax profundi]|uniref:MarR family transcriptional regulator n=1 Tax=Haloferax profundi TaxID=1544718 RepID=UPI0009EADBDD